MTRTVRDMLLLEWLIIVEIGVAKCRLLLAVPLARATHARQSITRWFPEVKVPILE